MKRVLLLCGLLGLSGAASGCVLAAAAGAGALAADEINEKDGKFDPLEKSYDGDDSTRPIIGDKKKTEDETEDD